MQFGVIYLDTRGSTLPYTAFMALEFNSCFFGFGIIYKKPHSLTLHEPVSVMACVKCLWLPYGWGWSSLSCGHNTTRRGSLSMPLSVPLSRNVFGFQWTCVSVRSQYQFHDVCNVFSLWPATLLAALHRSSAHNKQHLRLWSRFQPLQCLACRMLLLWQGTNCTVRWKLDVSINLRVQLK
jgi:hypothetical protein